MSNKITIRFLIVASALMAYAGGIFVFMRLWFYAVLLGVGALGCMVSAINFNYTANKK